MNASHREESCPVCEGADIFTCLSRARVPIHQNLVYRSGREAAEAPRADLDIGICRRCGFTFNRAFDPSLVLYGQAYDNTQTCSPSFAAYVGELVDHLVVDRNVRNADVIEVGCGKGHFIKALVNHPSANIRGIGFDPSYEGPLDDADGRLRFERRFYGPDCADVPADVVVCRHVIEHVQHPRPFLDSIRQALAQRPAAKVFFETPCVEWILRGQVIWDFFYEHCSLFSTSSLTHLFERAGFAVTTVKHTFGGQYLWLEARVAERSAVGRTGVSAAESAEDLVRLAASFAREEQRLTSEWLARLASRRQNGKVAIWGAGAKGVTFANIVDPKREVIDCVVDVNPNKQGGFIPGSAHPIVAPADLARRGVAAAMLMNPNYREENLTLLNGLAVAVELFS
jgi:SAM-dependent methyltransferase